MGPLKHLLSSTVVAGASYAATNSPSIAAAALGTGVLIDGDHLFDYGYYLLCKKCGRKQPNFKDFFRNNYQGTGKMFLPLHSYELLILLWLVSLAWLSTSLAIWLTVSFLTHIMLDHFSNRMPLRAYFFTFRLRKSFNKDTYLLSKPPISLPPKK